MGFKEGIVYRKRKYYTIIILKSPTRNHGKGITAPRLMKMLWEITVGEDPWGMIHVFYNDKELVFAPDERINEILLELKKPDEDRPPEEADEPMETPMVQEYEEETVYEKEDDLLVLLLPNRS